MKRIAALSLVLLMVLSGCCYAPGNERAPFVEKWMELPSINLNGYQSQKANSGNPGDADDETIGPDETIPAPEVDLDALPERENSDFVRVLDYIPDIVVDMKYATSNNFTGKIVYDFSELYLRYGTVVKLMKVQDALRKEGRLLKIWNGFCPLDAQQTLWEAKSDPTYISDPENGKNPYTRGNTVDVTLVDAQGNEIEMPTGFDVFTEYADRDYTDCTETAAANAERLQQVMEQCGFEGDEAKWWCFSDDDEYGVETVFDPGVIAEYYAVCNYYINIRVVPDVNASACGKINANERFTLLGWSGKMAYIEYQGIRGFVNSDFIAKV